MIDSLVSNFMTGMYREQADRRTNTIIRQNDLAGRIDILPRTAYVNFMQAAGFYWSRLCNYQENAENARYVLNLPLKKMPRGLRGNMKLY